jgi:hypothetical protein
MCIRNLKITYKQMSDLLVVMMCVCVLEILISVSSACHCRCCFLNIQSGQLGEEREEGLETGVAFVQVPQLTCHMVLAIEQAQKNRTLSSITSHTFSSVVFLFMFQRFHFLCSVLVSKKAERQMVVDMTRPIHSLSQLAT